MRGLNEFIGWLPGELEYSVRKAPYNKKLERAQLNITDGRSMFNFLATEWHHAQLLANQGAHYAPNHQKTAQLQFAKFAAGIFDKYGMVDWMQMGQPEDIEQMVRHSKVAAGRASSSLRHPSSMSHTDRGDSEAFLDRYHFELPFGLKFEEGVAKMQNDIVELARSEPSISDYGVVKANILKLGVRATASYLSFANANLLEGQLVLPASEL